MLASGARRLEPPTAAPRADPFEDDTMERGRSDTKRRIKQITKTRGTTDKCPPGSKMCSCAGSHRWSRLLLLAVATPTSAMLGLFDILERVDMDYPTYEEERLYLQRTIPPEMYNPLTSFLSSPLTLILGVLITVTSLASYRYIHRHERHQAPILIVSLATGIVIGTILGLDNIAILLRVSPWCAIIGLLVSTASTTFTGRREGLTPRALGHGVDEKA